MRGVGYWSASCSPRGVRGSHGFTLFELLVVMALISVMAAIGIPTVMESVRRNDVWTASELIGSQIRQARLKAISRNRTFRVRFNCPQTGQFRVLEVTGDGSIDNATGRCSTSLTYDSGVYVMPTGVSWGGDPPLLTVDSRGNFQSDNGIPAQITLTQTGGASRSLNMSATGQIAFDVHE